MPVTPFSPTCQWAVKWRYRRMTPIAAPADYSWYVAVTESAVISRCNADGFRRAACRSASGPPSTDAEANCPAGNWPAPHLALGNRFHSFQECWGIDSPYRYLDASNRLRSKDSLPGHSRAFSAVMRSEERRVGKECRSR